jgi:hypothetical protein
MASLRVLQFSQSSGTRGNQRGLVTADGGSLCSNSCCRWPCFWRGWQFHCSRQDLTEESSVQYQKSTTAIHINSWYCWQSKLTVCTMNLSFPELEVTSCQWDNCTHHLRASPLLVRPLSLRMTRNYETRNLISMFTWARQILSNLNCMYRWRMLSSWMWSRVGL